jgi:hypothetical protein
MTADNPKGTAAQISGSTPRVVRYLVLSPKLPNMSPVKMMRNHAFMV